MREPREVRDAKRVGNTIPDPQNSAEVISAVWIGDYYVVLCVYGMEYVVWSMDTEGNCENGNYYDRNPQGLIDATHKMIERATR